MSQIFVSGAQSIGVSATASFLSMNIQDWFPLRLTGWISLQSMGLKNLLKCHISKASILWHSAFFIVQLSHPYMTTGKTIPLTRRTFVGKVASLLFNMWSRWETWVQSLGWDDRLEKGKTTHSSILVCRIPWTVGSQGVRHDWATFKKKKSLVIAFLPRSKCLLILWLQLPSAVILEPPKIKSLTISIVSPPIYHDMIEPEAMILVFWMLCFKPTFSLSSFTFIKGLFSSSSLSAIRMVSSTYLRLLIFLQAISIPACASSSLECRRVTIYSLEVLLSRFGASLLFHVLL